jgi:hypothetical protein
MGWFAHYLAERLEAIRLPGWTSRREMLLLDAGVAARYGCSPRVDLLLSHQDGRRVAIELEIARADPVANQVKFLLAYRSPECGFGPRDALVSMFSSHIARGRRNIAGAFARHLRADGVPAFQVSLLPQLDSDTIRRLNHDHRYAARLSLPLRGELDRVLSVVEPRGEYRHRIHFAGDVADVMANLWQWNDTIRAAPWALRSIQFFVHDARSAQFAPAKFCAFIPSRLPDGPLPPPTMTLDLYAQLDERDPRFDGNRARKHLVDKLAFRLDPLTASPSTARAFHNWLGLHRDYIRPRNPIYLLTPPRWYTRPA